MGWIKRLFAPHIVVMSKPYSNGKNWSYIFGDENSFELRKSQTEEDAYSSYRATLTGIQLGPAVIYIRLIELDVEQAQAVEREADSYLKVIERNL